MDALLTPKELIGHTEVQQQLRHFIEDGTVPNGLLFFGPKGVGKRLAAENFAWSLICGLTQKTGLTYNPQSSFVPVLQHGAYRGFATLEKEGSAIKVHQVRAVTQKLALADEGWRVIIVDAADDLNPQAANALLKTLEEPTGQTVLILLCHNLSDLLPTLISRCRKVRFGPLEEENLKQVLQKEDKTDLYQEAFANFFTGSVGQAFKFEEMQGAPLVKNIEAYFKDPSTSVSVVAQTWLKNITDFPFFGELLLWKLAQKSKECSAQKKEEAYLWGALYQKVQQTLANQSEYNLTPQLALEEVLRHISKTIHHNNLT